MSNHANFLLAEGPGLCSRCHGDVVTAASSPTGHAAADDCLNCHQPHTSQQEHLLTEPQDLLCALCHDLQDPALTTAHLGAELTELECTLCHTPHGAGHPSLLQTNLHPPVEDGCDICHEGRFDELAESGTADLCLMCHDEIGELASAAAVPHGAMEMDDCTICHNPHASAQRSLVKLPGGEECADCHDDKLPAAEEFGHGAIELIGCEACHEPHGGERPALLRRSDDGLCLSCHGPRGVSADSQQVVLMDRFEVPGSAAAKMPALRLSADGLSGHPVLGHRVRGQPTEKEIKASGTSFTGELSCLTCHDPHKGRSQGLFQWDARSPMEVCQQCHDR